MLKKFSTNLTTVTLLATFVAILGFCAICSKAHPLDLYDDVSDLFQAMTLDEVPGADTAASTQDSQKDPKEFCRMPARKGVCRALIPRWSYDVEKKDCVEFKFGGCDGNDNNFSNYKECMAKCKDI